MTKQVVAWFMGSLLMSLLFVSSVGAIPRVIRPIVSTDWLQVNSCHSDLVIIDIRSAAEYQTGHINQAINVPFEVSDSASAWSGRRDDLLLEMPEQSDLFKTIGSCGITRNSRVVIVTSGPADPPYPLAGATRVAYTLIYAGIKNVAILDGGYAKWLAEGKPVSTVVPIVSTVTYFNEVNEKLLVSREYVHEQLGKVQLVDARDGDVYNGLVIESFAEKAGHIPTALSLPATLLWNTDGTYRTTEVLLQKVKTVIKNRNEEIILYCGVGGYASSWWYVLTQVLGYSNVKLFDGSAQEWVRYYNME